MNIQDKSVIQDWVLWLTMNLLGSVVWICACAIPLVVVGDRDSYLTGILFVSSQALISGIAQWLVVRWRVRQAGWWILATAIGWPVGLWAGIALVSQGSFIDTQASIVWPLVGLSLGLTQWLVLRNKLRHAWWWAVANPIIWGASGLIAAQVAATMNGPSVVVAPPASGVGLLTTWVLAESMRGLLLSWLLHRPVSGSRRAVGIEPLLESL